MEKEYLATLWNIFVSSAPYLSAVTAATLTGVFSHFSTKKLIKSENEKLLLSHKLQLDQKVPQYFFDAKTKSYLAYLDTIATLHGILTSGAFSKDQSEKAMADYISSLNAVSLVAPSNIRTVINKVSNHMNSLMNSSSAEKTSNKKTLNAQMAGLQSELLLLMREDIMQHFANDKS